MATPPRSVSRTSEALAGKRVLITGAARGIGAALAVRLHERGAHVAVAGLEPELLEAVAARSGDGPWRTCDVTDQHQVEAAVAAAVDAFGGLDVVVANAGIAAQLPIVGGDPEIMRRTLDVNVMGTYLTLRAAGDHLAHSGGYAVAVASLAAAIHVPLLAAYSASKAGVEAIGDTFRTELKPSGGKVGVAYFAELDTDMTSRGFDTRAADALTSGGAITRVTPLTVGIDALERGIARRSRRIVAPAWVGAVLPVRMTAQRVVDRYVQRNLPAALRIAREETIGFTTDQPADASDLGKKAAS